MREIQPGPHNARLAMVDPLELARIRTDGWGLDPEWMKLGVRIMASSPEPVRPLSALLVREEVTSSRPLQAVAIWMRRVITSRLFSYLMVAVAAAAIASAWTWHHAVTTRWSEVRMVHADGEARSVQVVGDFNGWNPESAVHMKQNPVTGYWSALIRLAPGRYKYRFLIDGERMINDPASTMDVRGADGEVVSIIELR